MQVLEKRAGSITGETDKRGIYKSAFNDLEDGACYHDPTGMRTGKSFTLKDQFFEQDKQNIEMFNEMQEKGFSVRQSIDKIQKALDTGDWTLPVYYLPGVGLVKPQMTPLADMLARQTTTQETINVTYVASGNEPSVNTGFASQNSDYTHQSITFTEKKYDVGEYNIMCGISDKMILASQPGRNPEAIVENTMLQTIRQFEEEEIIQDTNNIFSANDDPTLNGTYTTTASVDASSVTKSDFRDLIRDAETAGCSKAEMAIVTNFTARDTLANDLDSRTQYQMIDEEEFSFGYTALTFDGVPILPSHGVIAAGSATTGDPHSIAFNMSKLSLHMMADSIVRPLGRQGPQEKIAVDTYGALVNERPDHVFGLDQT